MSAKFSFFAELQRRHVYKVGAMYAVAGWLIVQVITQVFPIYEISAHVQRVFVGVIVAGFPLALVLAWLFDLTPEGIVRTSDRTSEGEASAVTARRRGTDRKLNYVLGMLLLAGLGYEALNRFTSSRPAYKPAESALSAGVDKSIAVLPFENLSDDKANAYFATGIQDEILTRLAKIGALKVISRTSTAHYASSPDNLPEIARQLGVANILEGSVQRIGDSVHINVQLIHSATDTHLWAESFDRKLDNVFSVESEVAQTIAQTLRARLSPAEAKTLTAQPTSSAAAYDAYLRGLASTLSSGGYRPATLAQIEAFSEAVRIDPQFAAAWAGLAQSHAFAYWNFDPSALHREAAREALDHALKLAPDALETRAMAGLFHYWIERDYAGATKIFERIREETPSFVQATVSLAAIARRQGRWADSLVLWEEAVALDPRNSDIYIDAAATAASMRQVRVAQTLLDQGLATAPDAPLLNGVQVELYQQQGRFDEAQAILDRTRINPGDDEASSFFRVS